MANKELKSITFEGLDDTYTLLTEEEVNTKLSEYAKTSEITQIDIQTVNALPEVGVKGVIYLVPSTLRMTPLLSNRLATVQANTNNSATFSVDKTTNIKAGMTLKFVSTSAMGEATVASVTASTKTVTLTTKATLAKGTLVFDNSKYGKDTCAEYIWNPSTNKFERLGIVDVNAVSTATPQSVVARDWNGRAQIENPSVAKDIANKDYVDNTVNTKLNEYAKTSELDKKLDKGNFSITENNITSPVDGKVVAQQTTQFVSLRGTNNSGNTDDFLDLVEYDSSDSYGESISTWGQEYTNEQLREMFQTAKVDFVPSPYNDWEFVSLTENTDNLVGQYRRTGNTSEVANLTYYLSNASSENANKFKSDYAYLVFYFYSTAVKSSERKVWDIVNPDLVVSASSTNSVSGKAVSNALAKKADKSELSFKLDSTALGTFSFNDYEFGSDSANASLYLGPYGGADVDRLYLNKNRIGKVKLDIGAGRVDTVWKIGQENSEAPTLTAGSKSETLENIIDAPSKITNKQDTLVSGTNIKTINGESVLGSGNISITTPIDDTLSNTSTNAVQNKVVKAAIDGKLNKTTGKQVVYTSDSAGNPSSLPYTTDATKNTIVLRQNNGAIKTGAPVANNDATTKEYVDSKAVTVIDNVTSTSTTAALSANQGKMLKLAIDDKLSSTIVNNDKETDILAGDISVTQINGSSGISGGIKIENAMPALYSGSKSETIENIIDSVEKVEDLSVLENDYDIISSSTWTYAGSNSGGNGEPNGKNCHYISYVCPINPQAIESAKIINPSTGATVATCTGQAELNANTHSTIYHFGNNYNIVIVRPQDGNIFGLQSGAVPSAPWIEDLYEGVFLTGPLINESSQHWSTGAINAGGLQSVKVDFGDTPLYARKPLVKTQYTVVSSQTLYKYITHLDTGIKECEILACVENVTINSPWGSLYEGTLGSYSFKSGFFTFEPEIHLEMLNTVTNDESGGVACFIETGIKPTTTSTGTLYAVRPNSGTMAKKIYFKIHAKQV